MNLILVLETKLERNWTAGTAKNVFLNVLVSEALYRPLRLWPLAASRWLSRLFINLIFVLETKFNPNQLYGVRYGHVLASVALWRLLYATGGH